MCLTALLWKCIHTANINNAAPYCVVPASPDLTAHARSLKGSILHSPQLDIRRLSLSSHDSDIGDMLLEGIGLGPGDVPACKQLINRIEINNYIMKST